MDVFVLLRSFPLPRSPSRSTPPGSSPGKAPPDGSTTKAVTVNPVQALPAKPVLREAEKLAWLLGSGLCGADSLQVTYQGTQPEIELRAGGVLLLQGALGLAFACDGEQVKFQPQWDWICWNTDEDGDYLELHLEGADGLKWERQFFLSRADHWLFTADCLTAPEPVDWDIVSQLRVPPRVKVAADRTTRQFALRSRLRRARLYPLAVPQFRVDSAGEQTAVEERDDGWQWTTAGRSRGIYMPLLIDWHPDRARETAQWRPLTISEEGQLIPRDVAAGYRLQIGSQQWLIYRSLHRSTEGRCLLGYHTRYESVVGTIQPDGTIKPLVQIE